MHNQSLSRTIKTFLKTESASSIVLLSCALIAILTANSSAAEAYFQFFKVEIFGLSVQHWINDGLMAVFFFVVGLEIKREILVGELSNLRKAALPVIAAIGGMVVPALIYFLINQNRGTNGWAIPMATDIAFAVGILSLLGNRVSASLKLFLLSLAIVDDIGAVLVIATIYTKELRVVGFLIVVAAVLAILLARRFSIKSYFLYITLGVVLWFGVLYSGVHASIAGVILGFLTPYSFKAEKHSSRTFSPLEELNHKIHPWVSFGIMPIFTLANAGIPLSLASAAKSYLNEISSGVFFGLVIGKPIGIMLFSALAVRLRLAVLPSGVRWVQLLGVSCVAGIGFTMSIFIANLSLAYDEIIFAKMAVLAASLVSAIIGGAVLSLFLVRKKSEVQVA